jgi:radical SAM superfamily enzyme YgiQ (UPF0313 family)
MNFLLLGINSNYIHTSLALYYIYTQIEEGASEKFRKENSVLIKEFSVNEHEEAALEYIKDNNIDVLAFSCYIWNISYIKRLISTIKELNKNITIIAGGPEAEYNGVVLYNGAYGGKTDISAKDTFIEFLEFIKNDNFENLSFPYNRLMIKRLENRIIYYESSRGCPYKCSYCLSATDNKIRYRDINKVKEEIDFFIESKVKLVKFVDRTFNIGEERTNEILAYIIKNSKKTTFHFEVNADILKPSTLNILKGAPKGILQFEIGLQSVNDKTLQAINRKIDTEKLFENTKEILKSDNIHVHLGLIAGLPFDDFEKFKESFNKAYDLKPHYLQLGFLKVLKNTPLESELKKHSIIYREYPPYEIISNGYIKQGELLVLKGIEEILMMLYNSKKFKNTLGLLRKEFNTPFEMYMKIYEVFKNDGILYNNKNIIKISECILKSNIINDDRKEILKETLLLDYLISGRSKMIPEILSSEKTRIPKKELHRILSDVDFLDKYLPSFKKEPVRDILKKILLIKLNHISNGFLIINYTEKDLINNNFQWGRFLLTGFPQKPVNKNRPHCRAEA